MITRQKVPANTKIRCGLPSRASSVWGSEVHRPTISGVVIDRIPQFACARKVAAPNVWPMVMGQPCTGQGQSPKERLMVSEN